MEDQSTANSFSQDSVINPVGKFKYNQEEEVTFVAYPHHYEDVFLKDCAMWSDKKKIYQLLGKFNQREHEKYAHYIFPRNPGEILFEKTVLILKNIWRKVPYLTQDNRQKSGEDYSTFTGIVNRGCERFKLKELTPNMFKCLIFVLGLTASGDCEIIIRILS